MKEQPIDTQTARLNAIAEMAALLRETTVKSLSYQTGTQMNDPVPSTYVYHNSIFTPEEHNSVKRMFLRLCSEV